MVELDHVSWRVGPHRIIDDVSVRFRQHRFNVVLGPNGAGKSTLLRLATGMLRPAAGTVRYAGHDVAARPAAALARERAVLSQHVDLAFPLSVADVVMMGRYPHYRRAPAARDRYIVEQAIALVGMTPQYDQPYPTLSGGEQQKAQLARVLAQIWDETGNAGDRYLFLDEPTSNLDIHYQLHLLDVARSFLQHRCTIVAILHDLNTALTYGDAFFVLDHGALVFETDDATTISPELIERVFSVRARRVHGAESRDTYWHFELKGNG